MPPDTGSIDIDLARMVEHLNFMSGQVHRVDASLIELLIKIEGRSFKGLIDTGASRTFVARSVVDSCQLQVEAGINSSHPQVKLADGSNLRVEGTVQVDIELDGLEYATRAMVLQMPHHDLIFGIEWLRQHRATLDFESNVVRFAFEDGTIKQVLMGRGIDRVLHLDVLDRAGLPFELLGHKEMNRISKSEDHCFLLMIRDSEEEEEDADIDGKLANLKQRVADIDLQKILERHKGVFRSDIPVDERVESIPKLRQLQDSIIPTGKEGPRNIRAYKLTASQLREQEQQVRELLDRGMIRESSSPWGFPGDLCA